MEKLCRKLPPKTKLSTGVYTACTYDTLLEESWELNKQVFKKKEGERSITPPIPKV